MYRMYAAITPSGTTGSATGRETASPEFHGELWAVYLSYASGITSTTVVQLRQSTAAGANAPGGSFMTITGTSPGWYFPRHEHGESSTGAPLPSTAGLSPYPLAELLEVRVGSSTPTTNAVRAWVYVKC